MVTIEVTGNDTIEHIVFNLYQATFERREIPSNPARRISIKDEEILGVNYDQVEKHDIRFTLEYKADKKKKRVELTIDFIQKNDGEFIYPEYSHCTHQGSINPLKLSELVPDIGSSLVTITGKETGFTPKEGRREVHILDSKHWYEKIADNLSGNGPALDWVVAAEENIGKGTVYLLRAIGSRQPSNQRTIRAALVPWVIAAPPLTVLSSLSSDLRGIVIGAGAGVLTYLVLKYSRGAYSGSSPKNL